MDRSEPTFRNIEGLDRPIWSALTSKHRSLAVGNGLARRYRLAVAPFAAVSELSEAAVAELRALATEGVIALLSSDPLVPLDGLGVEFRRVLQQMILVRDLPDLSSCPPEPLTARDVPAMLELTALTKPGPFLPETHRLGRYIGIRDGARLVAMAGERMRLDGFTEISAVCVHPDYRGRGYARTLMENLMASILRAGDVPFLHVIDDNTGAIALYERLGFKTRATFHLTVLRVSEATPA